jgi:hypothetical protein
MKKVAAALLFIVGCVVQPQPQPTVISVAALKAAHVTCVDEVQTGHLVSRVVCRPDRTGLHDDLNADTFQRALETPHGNANPFVR